MYRTLSCGLLVSHRMTAPRTRTRPEETRGLRRRVVNFCCSNFAARLRTLADRPSISPSFAQSAESEGAEDGVAPHARSRRMPDVARVFNPCNVHARAKHPCHGRANRVTAPPPRFFPRRGG